jgi:CheY-like chemotaxis protein
MWLPGREDGSSRRTRELQGTSLVGDVPSRARGCSPLHGGDVPALALTAYAHAEDGRRALAAGFQLHVAKPVEPGALARAVARRAGRLKVA